MSGDGWPGLGFDPAPGNTGSAGQLAAKLDRTAKYLRETYDVLHRIEKQQDVWTGKAAKAFTERLGELPKYLDHAQQSVAQAGKLLHGWGDRLTGYQNQARELERKARQARQQYEQAQQAEEQAQSNPELGLANQMYRTPEEAQTAQQRYDAAQAKVDSAAATAEKAYAGLEELIRAAEQLQEKHNGDGDATAEKIARADDGLAPPEPGFFEQIGEFLKENLKAIGDIAGMISAVAGALAFIPILAPVAAPIAVATGGIALAAHSADMAIKGKFDAVTLGTDALGMIPGVKAVKAGVEGVQSAAGGMRSVDGLVEGARAMGRDMDQPTALVGKLGEVVTGSEVAGRNAGRIAEGAIGVGTQVPTAVGMAAGPSPGVDAAQTGAGYVGLGASANAAGHAAGPPIASTIGRLASAVG